MSLDVLQREVDEMGPGIDGDVWACGTWNCPSDRPVAAGYGALLLQQRSFQPPHQLSNSV